MFFETLDVVFAPLIGLGQVVAITAISAILSLVLTLIYKFFSDNAALKQVKQEMELHRTKSTEAQKAKDVKAMNEALDKMMGMNKKYMSLIRKPMLVSMVFFMVFLPWLSDRFATLSVRLPLALPFAGTDLGWFWWYFLVVILFNSVLKKLLDVEM